MASVLEILGTVLSILGLLAVLCQFVSWAVQRKLPRATLRVLEDTLAETDSLLTRCIEEGRLSHGTQAAGFRATVDHLQGRASDLRLMALSGRGYVDDIRHMLRGLSREMEDLCEEVRTIRAEISTSSASSSSQSENGSSMSSVDSTAPLIGSSTHGAAPSGSSASSSCGSSSLSAGSQGLAEDYHLIAPPLSELSSSEQTPPSAVRSEVPLPHTGDGSLRPLSYKKTQPQLHEDKRKFLPSSQRTTCTPSLRRKKQGAIVSRTRALARSARLSYA